MRAATHRLQTIGGNIARFRESRGFTKLELASRAGIDDSQLSKMERGLRGTSIEGYEAIARALRVDLATLLSVPRRRSAA